MNAVVARGISSESVKAEFDQHAGEEQQHTRQVAERINQLGGIPDFNPEGLTTRVLLESILSKEEEHANDMLDLLAAHQG